MWWLWLLMIRIFRFGWSRYHALNRSRSFASRSDTTMCRCRQVKVEIRLLSGRTRRVGGKGRCQCRIWRLSSSWTSIVTRRRWLWVICAAVKRCGWCPYFTANLGWWCWRHDCVFFSMCNKHQQSKTVNKLVWSDCLRQKPKIVPRYLRQYSKVHSLVPKLRAPRSPLNSRRMCKRGYVMQVWHDVVLGYTTKTICKSYSIGAMITEAEDQKPWRQRRWRMSIMGCWYLGQRSERRGWLVGGWSR